MQCLNCQNEVPSKFAYAIKTNVCPFCGKQIMAPELQKVLNGLNDLLSDAAEQDFTTEATNWLCSNLDLVSRGSEEFLLSQEELLSQQKEIEKLKQELQVSNNRFTKPIPKSGKAAQLAESQLGLDEAGQPVQLQGEIIQDPGDTQGFLARAQVTKSADQNDHFRKMVSQIKKGGGAGGEGGFTSAQLSSATAEEVEQMELQLSGGVPIIASGIDNDYENEDALPPIAEAFIAGGAGKQQPGYNPRDIAKLQALQQKSSRATRAMDAGGSVGLIRR